MEQLGAIDGLTTEERFLRAEILVERINADVVVYGVIERNGDALYLTPEFYVGIENFYEAEEMVGQYVLGESILILEVFDNLPSQIRPCLLSRRVVAQCVSLIKLGYGCSSLNRRS